MSAAPVQAPKTDALKSLFGKTKPVIGVIHSLPLPGAPRYDGQSVEEIYTFAENEAVRYAEGGVDGLIVENHGDIPFAKPEEMGPETAAAMAVMTERVRRAVSLPTGVNVLANDARTAIAVSKAADAVFFRVNQWANAYVANEGFVEGPAGRAARYRAFLRASGLKIFADVHVKHGAHAITADRTIAELVRDVEFFDADVCIATGQRTGDAATGEELRAVKDAASVPVVVGSGVTPDNVGEILSVADGVIVASALKQGGVWWNPVEPDRVKRLMREVAKVR